MIDLNEKYLQENSLILLNSIWYAELPPILNFNDFSADILNVIESIQNKNSNCYDLDDDNFIVNFKSISSPPYIRRPGVEPITFYDVKNNGSLREMQIPNLQHYIAFIYNTIYMYDEIFSELYINKDNKKYICNSNSYLMFEKTFKISHEYDDFEIEAGIFAERNNKITSNARIATNRNTYYKKQGSYIYKLSIDLESFFPNLYTHYFHRIYNKEPFKSLSFPEKYFEFLDVFHQRINANQTKGIPAGVFSSHVAAELSMICVDYEISKLIENKDISYIRYVDDFTFFSNSQELLEDLKIKLQQILNEYRLRINGNKTKLIPCIYDYPKVDMQEIENDFFWIVSKENVQLTDKEFVHLKKYFTKLIQDNNFSQIKTCITLIVRKLSNDLLNLKETEEFLFSYLLQLSQTYIILSSRVYKLIDMMVNKSSKKDKLIKILFDYNELIDNKYSNTILQIWHYYTIINNCNNDLIDELIAKLDSNNNNPVILASLVKIGKKSNTKLFQLVFIFIY